MALREALKEIKRFLQAFREGMEIIVSPLWWYRLQSCSVETHIPFLRVFFAWLLITVASEDCL